MTKNNTSNTCDVIMRITLCACLLLTTLPLVAAVLDPETASQQIFVRSILDPIVYDKRVRPAGLNGTSTVVGMNLNLVTINDLDPVTETLITTAFLDIGWVDQRLTPNKIVPVTTIRAENIIASVPQDEVWRPDISLKNSYADLKPLGNKYMYIQIYASGVVAWYPYHVFQSNCDLDTSHFPFDVQTCELQFSAWSFNTGQVDFMKLNIALDSYRPSSQFDLINYTTQIVLIANSSVAVFTFELKRKPLFVVMTTVVPIVMLALLNTCVFILPYDSGEKISYSVTVFLAFMVTLTYVSTILPENSDSVSYLALYVTSQVAQSTLQTFITIVFCRWYLFDENEKPVPKVLVILAQKVCLSKKNKANINSSPRKMMNERSKSNIPTKRKRGSMLGQDFKINNTAYANHVSLVDLDGRDVRGDSLENIPVMDTPVDVRGKERDGDMEKVSGDTEQVTWKTVVNGLDTICLIFFLLLFIACTVLYVTASVLGI